MKHFRLFLFIVIASFDSSHAQLLTSQHSYEFALSKLEYVDACQELYAKSERVCECSFEFMRNNYKVRFYQDAAFLNIQHQQRTQLVNKIIESFQICTALEQDEFAYPRRFD